MHTKVTKKILVFTDLDGSLLNHYNYSWKDAVPALTRLYKNSYPVIFTSSKTFAEIHQIKQEMGNRHPCISENGAVVNIPCAYFEPGSNDAKDSNFDSYLFAKPYKEIIAVLKALRDEYQFVFRGFNDIHLDELIALTDLSEEQAKLSKQREASEPLLWKGTADDLEYFEELLKKEDLIITKGGRFYHVMSDINKGKTINWLFKKYQEMEPDTDWITIGLGDSYNDIEMLESVDYPVLITNPGTKQPDLSEIKHLYKTQMPGPQGWNEAVFELLNQIV